MQDEDCDMPFSQLRAGESLLEIHIKVKIISTLFVNRADSIVKTKTRYVGFLNNSNSFFV